MARRFSLILLALAVTQFTTGCFFHGRMCRRQARTNGTAMSAPVMLGSPAYSSPVSVGGPGCSSCSSGSPVVGIPVPSMSGMPQYGFPVTGPMMPSPIPSMGGMEVMPAPVPLKDAPARMPLSVAPTSAPLLLRPIAR